MFLSTGTNIHNLNQLKSTIKLEKAQKYSKHFQAFLSFGKTFDLSRVLSVHTELEKTPFGQAYIILSIFEFLFGVQFCIGLVKLIFFACLFSV